MSEKKDHKPTILVIDDEQIVLDACKRIFGAEGYQVVTASTP
jgi:CheY-like chemotaxis protein